MTGSPLTAPWLAVVGIGEDGLDGLAPPARAQFDAAEILVGGTRHLAMVPDDGRPRLCWPSPLTALIETLAGWRGQRVCVLASGDPQWFGVGTTLSRHFSAAEMVIIPNVSSFSLACARLHWPIDPVECITLHGRRLDSVGRTLQPGARIVALSTDGTTPAALAALLVRHGYGASRLTVLEHLGGPAERRIESTAATWTVPVVADLNTVAIECPAHPEARLLPLVPGLPDAAFAHDGQLTKREVRAITLAALAPVPGQLLWDVGAGSGSVAIEWLRSHPRNRAIAIERDPQRGERIQSNAANLGVPALKLVAGLAPAALTGLEPPDAIFVGGGVATPGLIAACWAALSAGGRLVANAVTLEGEAVLYTHWHQFGGDLRRLAISHAEPIGGCTGWRAAMPVTQWAAIKP
ncbi:MAG: precorrin-6y C5,15-methyltransferase (decarboxylating) subunit CbiE [Azospirillaceae bacterium]|nr:precorrin-6y C5,15-methyltransferase (decarboxylating) subunit CbiE [Azospirillaceae bacterium]